MIFEYQRYFLWNNLKEKCRAPYLAPDADSAPACLNEVALRGLKITKTEEPGSLDGSDQGEHSSFFPWSVWN